MQGDYYTVNHLLASHEFSVSVLQYLPKYLNDHSCGCLNHCLNSCGCLKNCVIYRDFKMETTRNAICPHEPGLFPRIVFYWHLFILPRILTSEWEEIMFNKFVICRLCG